MELSVVEGVEGAVETAKGLAENLSDLGVDALLLSRGGPDLPMIGTIAFAALSGADPGPVVLDGVVSEPSAGSSANDLGWLLWVPDSAACMVGCSPKGGLMGGMRNKAPRSTLTGQVRTANGCKSGSCTDYS